MVEYKLTEEREKNLWEKAIFVFDTSAILDFYFLPKSTREKVFDDLFAKKLKGRLWLPSHVKYEYEKNRENIIKKPITKNYKPLKDDIIKKIKDSVSQIEKQLEEFINRTKNNDKHPHLDQKDANEFTKYVSAFKKQTQSFEDSTIKEINEVEKEINNLPSNDDVFSAIQSHFELGREYAFDEIIDITKEGKHRYEFSIPPGYEDIKTKIGTQIFGDLIIWKQIIEFAKKKKLPIIFICNDLKEDWCHINSPTDKSIKSPRAELLKEIYDAATVHFWMYNQAQFLYLSNNYLDGDIEKQNIDELLKHISSKKTEPDKLIFRCNNCNRELSHYEKDLDMDFECIGGTDRNMGSENQYEAIEHFECACGNEVEVSFQVWEYPEGAHNYDTIEISGGELIDCFPFTINFHGEPDTCGKCGAEYIDENGIGICQKCEDEYAYGEK